MGNEPKPRVDFAKLKDVVHYVCAQCNQDELGNVKLHKILYFADMLHYLSLRKPLTRRGISKTELWSGCQTFELGS